MSSLRTSGRRLTAALIAPVIVVIAAASLTGCQPGVDCDTAVYHAGANLSGTNQAGKQLQLCVLSNANLSGATLTGANLTAATLSVANLNGVAASGVTLTYGIATTVDLTNADLTAATLRATNLDGANLTHTDLSGADLTASRGPGNGTKSYATFSATTVCADGTPASAHGNSCLGIGAGW